MCPIPGIYAVTSEPFVRRTRAIFRSAEFGFFGVVVDTFTHTPRLKGQFKNVDRFLIVFVIKPKAGDFDFRLRDVLG